MSRPRKIRSDNFSYRELAIGGGMSKRDFQFLAESGEGLLPGDLGIRDLKRIASIGACMSAGLPLLTSARLAKTILLEFNREDGEVPCGLNHLALRLPPDAMKLVPPSADRTNDYHWHHALIRYPDIYPKGKALGSDVIVEIVDFKLLFSSTRQFPAPTLIGWIDRGNDTRVVHAIEKIGPVDDQENPGWRAQLEQLETDALAERENAVARTAINFSLAIRRALDRIAEHRGAQFAKFEPSREVAQ